MGYRYILLLFVIMRVRTMYENTEIERICRGRTKQCRTCPYLRESNNNVKSDDLVADRLECLECIDGKECCKYLYPQWEKCEKMRWKETVSNLKVTIKINKMTREVNIDYILEKK